MTANDLRPYYLVAQTIYDFFVSHGFTPEQACGVVANADAESSMRVNVVGDKGHAFGLFQLHADRADLIKAGCGIDIRTASAADQCSAVLYELNHTERRAMTALRQAKTAYDAAHDFCRFYERPGSTLQYAIRGDKGEQWLLWFKKHSGAQ